MSTNPIARLIARVVRWAIGDSAEPVARPPQALAVDLAALETAFAANNEWRKQGDGLVLSRADATFRPAAETAPAIAGFIKAALVERKQTAAFSTALVHNFVAYLAADAKLLDTNERVVTVAVLDREAEQRDLTGFVKQIHEQARAARRSRV